MHVRWKAAAPGPGAGINLPVGPGRGHPWDEQGPGGVMERGPLEGRGAWGRRSLYEQAEGARRDL